MKRKSLQEIEDFYVKTGHKEDKLRQALEKDKEYQKLLNERKQKLTKKFKVSTTENRKYVLSTNTDFDILAKCKHLEKMKLSKKDREFVRFVKTQLEHDWRKPIIRELDKLMREYK